MMEQIEIGVLGGCGLYQMDALKNVTRHTLSTPFGATSGDVIIGTLADKRVAFIPRHGEDHTLPPSRVPYRANIFALKTLGVRFVISVNACGSLREDYTPGHFVIPDQIYDQTRLDRGPTFFEDGITVHTSTANPFCNILSDTLHTACQQTVPTVHRGGRFVVIEGPRFSTKAESHIFRQLGCDIIGMTSSPEAFLAREAEVSYASMAYVTDYDVWRQDVESVTICGSEATMDQSATYAQHALIAAVEALDVAQVIPVHTALDDAILTEFAAVPQDVKNRLRPILARRFASHYATTHPVPVNR
jgi:5'-methylthioadenosine phosphorylase